MLLVNNIAFSPGQAPKKHEPVPSNDHLEERFTIALTTETTDTGVPPTTAYDNCRTLVCIPI